MMIYISVYESTSSRRMQICKSTKFAYTLVGHSFMTSGNRFQFDDSVEIENFPEHTLNLGLNFEL